MDKDGILTDAKLGELYEGISGILASAYQDQADPDQAQITLDKERIQYLIDTLEFFSCFDKATDIMPPRKPEFKTIMEKGDISHSVPDNSAIEWNRFRNLVLPIVAKKFHQVDSLTERNKVLEEELRRASTSADEMVKTAFGENDIEVQKIAAENAALKMRIEKACNKDEILKAVLPTGMARDFKWTKPIDFVEYLYTFLHNKLQNGGGGGPVQVG